MFKQIISLVSGGAGAKETEKAKNTSFCESCGEVCGSSCRSEAILEQTKEKFTSFQSGVTARF
ncbi:MAG: hypothetical protein J0I20_29975 [Chloroflexi bacterium]|nr:hypothetical protein [Chloroflexota bacterium]OJV99091.1 MAG: hypothetical protein BGO39_16655 [Chloroflexi bacterium 54-19]